MSSAERAGQVHENSEIEVVRRELETVRAEFESRINALEKRLAQAANGVIRNESTRDETHDQSPKGVRPIAEDESAKPAPSRRELLKKGGIGVAAAAAGAAAFAKPAAAADGDPLELGSETNLSFSPTALGSNVTSGFNFRNLFMATSNPGITGSSFPAAVAGYGYTSPISVGVYGFSDTRDASDADTGHAVVASPGPSARSNLLLRPRLPDPRDTTYGHRSGEVIMSDDLDLWVCVGSGTPGTWRKLAAPSSSGAVHAILPKRVWDTRFQGGPMATGESRTVSVADGRVLSSATVDVPDLVPAGAQAVTMNLSVVGTGSAGFMAVTPGGASTFTAASINWHTANSILNNGTMTTVNANREVTVWCNGTGHFIIDITGYLM